MCDRERLLLANFKESAAITRKRFQIFVSGMIGFEIIFTIVLVLLI